MLRVRYRVGQQGMRPPRSASPAGSCLPPGGEPVPARRPLVDLVDLAEALHPRTRTGDPPAMTDQPWALPDRPVKERVNALLAGDDP